MTNPRSVVRRALPVLVAAGLVLTAAACSDDDGGTIGSTTASSTPSPDRSEVLATLADGVIVPSYAELGDDLEAFEAAVGALCDAPTQIAVDQARSEWHNAVTSWETTTAFGIGPAMEDRLMSDVGFAARITSIQRLLDGDRGVDVESVRSEGAAVRGLFAAELVLFGEEAAVLSSPDGERRCEYLRSVATLASEKAAEVVGDWSGGSARDTFIGATGSDAADTLPMLLNQVTHRVKAIDEQSLRDIAAADTYDDLAEARGDGPAGFGIGRQRAALRGAVAVIGSGSNGLVGMVGERSPETAERLRAAAGSAQEALDALHDSVSTNFADPGGAARLDTAAERVAALKVILATEVASQLGVTITLSDGDGDA